jgi:CheY-like chemotaxis protein
VVDDEEEVRNDAMLQFQGEDDVCVVMAATQDEAIEAIERSYFDAAIVDIELGDSASGSAGGYEVLREFAEVAPDTPLIVATKHVDPSHVRDLIRFVNPGPPRIVKIFDKAPLDRDREQRREHGDAWMKRSLEPILETWRAREVTLTNGELALELLRERAPRIPQLREGDEEIATELDRICRSLFGDISGLARGSETGVVLRPIGSPGLSAAIAVEAIVTLGEDVAGKPVTGSRCVLKIGPVDGIREEVERYEHFVKFGVRLTQRVELLEHTYHHALGAVCYSFAGGVFGDALVSLEELLRSPEDSPLARDAISKIFALSSQNWYSVQCDGVSSRTYMSQTYDTNFSECYERLDGTLKKLERRLRKPELQKPLGGYIGFERPDDGNDGSIEVGGTKLVVPRKNVLGDGQMIAAIPACLVHGDMHGGNVMLELAGTTSGDGDAIDAELRRVCLIDYRSSGPGPRAVDAVALQASLRLADALAIVREVAPDADPASLDDVQLANAVRIAAARTKDDVAALRQMWGGRMRKLRARVDQQPWQAVDAQIASATLENFKDLSRGEYLAIAIPFTLQQIGYRIGTVARMRMLAWLSAQYAALPEKD